MNNFKAEMVSYDFIMSLCMRFFVYKKLKFTIIDPTWFNCILCIFCAFAPYIVIIMLFTSLRKIKKKLVQLCRFMSLKVQQPHSLRANGLQ